jgi:hypothetical protein
MTLAFRKKVRVSTVFWRAFDKAVTDPTKEFLIAPACNHPNLLVLPFSLELIRLAA